MSRLVIVSNRVADLRKPSAGGLAVAVGEALEQTGGLWFGWSGAVADSGAEIQWHRQKAGDVTLITVDLCRSDYDRYYGGYSNGMLWPVFHNRLDLARFDPADATAYQRVNQQFARLLLSQLREDDILWVHDYHLIPLAAELRALGCRQRIGFFLHIPFPPQIVLAAVPQHEWLVRSLFAYDLIGLQTQQDVRHFEGYVCEAAHGKAAEGGVFRAYGLQVACQAFPIGIDVDGLSDLARSASSQDMYKTLRQEYAQRRLLLGIDRLDYSKGLPQRLQAFRHLLATHPESCRSATLIQVGSPTREFIDAYADIRRELETLCGSVNGDYGELDWMPVRYVHQTVPRESILGMCRAAHVGVVTPLRDGMNLVAKEYVAAQDAEDPGVLVLSRFAGAAEQLHDALLVNPYDIHSTAQTLQQALQMPLNERRIRHQNLLSGIRQQDVHWWRATFLAALASCRSDALEGEELRGSVSAPAQLTQQGTYIPELNYRTACKSAAVDWQSLVLSPLNRVRLDHTSPGV